MDDSFLESIFMRPQTTSGFCSEVFSDPPSSPPCFRLKCFVLLNLIIMHSVVFSRTLTQSLCFPHMGLSRDLNQTGVICSLTLLITLLKHATVKASFSSILPLSFTDQLFRNVCLFMHSADETNSVSLQQCCII